MQIPQDYSPVMMCMEFVHRDAPNLEAAKTFMNFLLGAEGQRVLAGDTPVQRAAGSDRTLSAFLAGAEAAVTGCCSAWLELSSQAGYRSGR